MKKKIKPVKYLELNSQQIFVGSLINAELVKLSNTFDDIIYDAPRYYSLIFNTKILNEIMRAYSNINNQLKNMIKKYENEEFEYLENWSDVMIDDIISLFTFIESIEERLSPEKYNLSHNKCYSKLHNCISGSLVDLSTILFDYLRIEEYQESDRSKFHPFSQIHISVANDYTGDIDVIPHRSGFYDMLNNKIIKKEIVSIRQADNLSNNSI